MRSPKPSNSYRDEIKAPSWASVGYGPYRNPTSFGPILATPRLRRQLDDDLQFKDSDRPGPTKRHLYWPRRLSPFVVDVTLLQKQLALGSRQRCSNSQISPNAASHQYWKPRREIRTKLWPLKCQLEAPSGTAWNDSRQAPDRRTQKDVPKARQIRQPGCRSERRVKRLLSQAAGRCRQRAVRKRRARTLSVLPAKLRPSPPWQLHVISQYTEVVVDDPISIVRR